MSDFPTLEPAFTIQVEIEAPMGVGSSSRGTPMAVVPMTGGTMKSESGFSPAIDAKFKGVGNDYIHNDPTGKHMRLNAHGVLETSDGELIYLNYTGVVDITPALGAILGGSPDAKSTSFGNSCLSLCLFRYLESVRLIENEVTHLTFETGSEKYKELETSVFVSAGRFVVEKDKPTVAEYKVSRVKHG